MEHPMAASSSSGSPSRRPTSRTLGAVFAGSALMFSAAALHGGSLITDARQAEPAATPSASTDAEQSPAATISTRNASTAPLSAGQATPWTPGATPDWNTPLRDRPVHRAPVRATPKYSTGAHAPSSDGTAATRGPVAQHTPPAKPAEKPPGLIDQVLNYLGQGP